MLKKPVSNEHLKIPNIRKREGTRVIIREHRELHQELLSLAGPTAEGITRGK